MNKEINITLYENNIGSPYIIMGSFDRCSLFVNVDETPENERLLINEFYVLFDGRLGNYISNTPFDYQYIDINIIKPEGPSRVESEYFDFELMDSNVKSKIIELYNLLDKYLIKD
jgi:hypothetical protein